MMKAFKTELLIFIHNFFTVLFILSGWQLLIHAPNLLGHIIGFITLAYGCYMFFSALKKGVDEFVKTNYPNVYKKYIEELEKKKGDN